MAKKKKVKYEIVGNGIAPIKKQKPINMVNNNPSNNAGMGQGPQNFFGIAGDFLKRPTGGGMAKKITSPKRVPLKNPVNKSVIEGSRGVIGQQVSQLGKNMQKKKKKMMK